MDKIIQFWANEPRYDILTDTPGCLSEDIFKRYNIRIADSPMTDIGKTTEFLRPSLDAGRDVLYICNTELTDANKAAEALMSAYPDRHIVCVKLPSVSENDSLKTVKMSRLRAAGATLDEAAAFFKNHRQNTAASFPTNRYSWPVATAISM